MESLRVHGVTVEVPTGLSNEARVAFFDAFVRETPAGLAPDEAALHVELFLATHGPKPAAPQPLAPEPPAPSAPGPALDPED